MAAYVGVMAFAALSLFEHKMGVFAGEIFLELFMTLVAEARFFDFNFTLGMGIITRYYNKCDQCKAKSVERRA